MISLSKIAAMAKQSGFLRVVRTEDASMCLCTRAGIYKADGLPMIFGDRQARAVLSMTEKSWDKITYEEEEVETLECVFGMDLRDYAAGEVTAQPLKITALPEGRPLMGLETETGELFFYESDMLKPVEADLKESEYRLFTIRTTEAGKKYICVHNGMELLCVILPVEVVTEKYLADMGEFQAKITAEFFRKHPKKA